ncbi:MAG: hypothetical protein JWN70_5385 [Planctomycetaceae bacterium]|nr:hypothetical protein [Planctomycetaceae bacterium]
MEPNVELTPALLEDLKLGGVVWERREKLIQYVMDCLRLKMTEEEIRPMLVDFIKNKGWPWMELDARFGLVAVARTRLGGDRPPVPEPVPEEFQATCLADVAPEPVPWLWPRYLEVGKVTVVYGDAGVGKTSFSLDLAARVSAGLNWPFASIKPVPLAPEPGKVLLVNGEDHLGSMIRPRLAGSGANLQNLIYLSGLKAGEAGDERPFDPGRDISALKQQIETRGEVRLVIIDPLEAYCTAGPRTAKMRTVLAALEKLARDCGVAVVVISARTRCDLPVKTVWRVDREVVDPDVHWLVPVRSGSGRVPPVLGFEIEDEGLVWKPNNYGYREDQLQGCSLKVRRHCRRTEVASWLSIYLGCDKPHYVRDVLDAGVREGYSESEVRSARREQKVVSYKESGVHGQWIWEFTDRKIPFNNPPLGSSHSPPVAAAPERHDQVFERRPSQASAAPGVAVASDRDDSDPPRFTYEELQKRLREWDKEFERVTGLKADFD